jgi:lipopolysaccharide export LptBFGC system permease protein LptF
VSGETEASVSGWTVDTLREHLTQRLNDQGLALNRRMDDADKAINAALVSAEKAVTKAETASEKRFEGVNEFRGVLQDQQRDLLRRGEYNSTHEALSDRVTALTDRLAALELRLTSRLDLNQGSTDGSSETRTERRLDLAALMQFLGLVAVAIGLYIAFHK